MEVERRGKWSIERLGYMNVIVCSVVVLYGFIVAVLL